MSLINDALKRAKQAQKQDPPPAVPGAPLRPAEIAARRAPTVGILWLLLGALLLGVTAAVLFFLVLRGGKTGAPTIAQRNTPPATATPVKPAPPAEPIKSPAVTAAPKPAPISPPAEPPVVTTPAPPAPTTAPVTPAETTPLTNAPAPVVVAAPALPKLQGILYRSDRPSALLNGKTVFVGSRSGEFQVVAITQESVTVVRAGTTNVLSLVQ